MSFLKSYITLKKYRANPLKFISDLHKDHGHRIHLRIFGKELFIISHPDDVVHILKTNNSFYTKGRTTKALRQFLGNGLITNEGDSWKKQHRMIRPVMNNRSVLEIAPRILETCLEYIPLIKDQSEINSLVEMNRLTWRIILKTLFSEEVTPALDNWLEDILELMRIITLKTRSSIPVPFWVPTSKHRRMKEIIRKFDQHVFNLIQQRRDGEKKHDLLQLLIDAQEEGTSRMTDREIRDEIMTFMMAGHETITNSMAWTLIELSNHPEYKDRILKESEEFFQSKDFEILNNLPWHGAVLDEVMRLRPPVWVFMREAEQEDRLGDLVIPRKANVVLAPYLSHRSPDFWENPEVFHPERFLGDSKKKLPQGAFYPFGLGPRGCIGAYFAGTEARVILATLIKHFDWDIINPTEQKFEAGISLRPANNVTMKFKGRK
jgi:cytochrome P450